MIRPVELYKYELSICCLCEHFVAAEMVTIYAFSSIVRPRCRPKYDDPAAT